MKRTLQVLAIATAVVAGFIFFLLENPDRFKEQLSDAVSANTAYDVAIAGDLSWRYWPPIAIQAEAVSLESSGRRLATFERMAIDVDLIPLLTKQHIVDINLLSLSGGTVEYERDSGGQSNWQAEPESDNSDPSSGRDVPPPPALHQFSIEALKINYRDHQSGSHYTFDIASLHTTRLAVDTPFDLSLNAIIIDHAGARSTPVGVSGRLIYQSTDRIRFDDLLTTTTWQDLPEARILTSGEWHLERDALILNKAEIHVSALLLSSTGIVNLTPSPRFDGEIKLESADMKQLAADFDTEVPVSTLLMTGGLTSSEEAILITGIEGSFDSTGFRGNASITPGRVTSVSGDLRLDQLSTDLYVAGNTSQTGNGSQGTKTPDNELLPISALKELNIDGIIRIDQLHHDTRVFTSTKVEIDNDTKHLSAIANTQAYEGKLVASLDTDLEQADSTLKLTMDRINVSSLDSSGAITGALTGHSNLYFEGSTMQSLEETLTGKSNLTVSDGTLDIRPLKQLARTIDTIRGKQSRVASWPDTMPFEHMMAQHVFQGGTRTGQVFNSQLENLHLTALGGFDLTAGTLDYAVTAMFENGSNGQFRVSDQMAGIRWPMTCQGTFSESPADLCFGQDNAIRDLIADLAKQELKRRGNERLDELIEDKVPEELRDLTRDLFKGLFK